MKIWITAPYDPNGIEEAEATDDSTDAYLVIMGKGISYYWFCEGKTWHRTKEAAVQAARAFRAAWIKEATEKASKVAAYPPITT